ncbi:hypothetical protein [Undibacterium sp.]|uniref:hypothetical protein n=1 Tax=Undibacterium sp. TaxID=1914977 RepID=UPI0037517B22
MAAVDVIAQKFQTQVQVSLSGYGLRIDFVMTDLTGPKADALLAVEDLIEAN